jgi:hypothetical protein
MSRSRKAFAVVAAMAEGKGLSSAIVSGTQFLMEDIREAYGGGSEPSDSIGEPDSAGLWMWEGAMIVRKGYEGDVDVDYEGTYRRLTDDEVQKLALGELKADWIEDDEQEPEAPEPGPYSF